MGGISMSAPEATCSKGRYPSSDEVMAEARRKTGLSDFGPDSFRDGLGMFLDSLDHEVDFNDEQAGQLLSLVLRRLTNRLDNRGMVPDPSGDRGSFLGSAGFHHGPTAHRHLGARQYDVARRRVPLSQILEQSKPCPPPVLGDEMTDPRRIAIVDYIAQMTRANPEQMASHLWSADATEEDVEILGLDFRAQQLALPIYKYWARWRDADLRPTFAYHRRVMQLLQSRRPPNRWLFKAPAHSFHLEAIVSAYPDARFIVTHRDPAKAVPSAISLIFSLLSGSAWTSQGMPSDADTDAYREKFGRLNAEHSRIGTERAIAARARIGEHRFLDIHHRDFQRDAFGTLDRVYGFLGLDLRPRVRDAMAQWHAANRSGAHGVHRYTAGQYGLSVPQLRSDFDPYIRRFDVPLED